MSETGAAPAHEPGEQYDGPAVIDGTGVQVRLRGHFQPIDGRFHWWGRIGAHPALAMLSSGTTVTLETPHGSAGGRVSDLDPWGRFRITGTGTPPF